MPPLLLIMKKFTPIILALIAVILFYIPNAHELLQYDYVAINEHYQYYRLFTGHFVHYSESHLYWDVITFAVLGALCCRKSLSSFFIIIIATPLIISLSLLYFMPQLMFYRGLSGIDTALYSFVIGKMIYDKFNAKKFIYGSSLLILALLLMGKTVYEFTTHSILFANANNFIPLPVAHLIGIFCGLIVFFLFEGPNLNIKKAPRENRGQSKRKQWFSKKIIL